MALVAHGASDVYLHGNPQVRIFDKTYKRTARSNFTYLRLDLINTGDCAWSAHFEPKCDLLGDCYLCYTPKEGHERVGVDDVVSCSFTTTMKNDRRRILETLYPQTLEAFARMRPDSYEMQQSKTQAVVPLPFFFTRAPEDFFSLLASQESRPSIECVLSDNALKPYIMYQGVYLDTLERRESMAHAQKLCVVSETIAVTEESDSEGVVRARITSLYGECKDLQIIIDGNPAVEKIDVRFAECLHMSLDAVMSSRIIPRKFYGINQHDQADPLIHYFPFCQAPCTTALTSAVHLGRIDYVDIVVHGLEKNKSYGLHIINQHFNVLLYMDKVCGFMYATQ